MRAAQIKPNHTALTNWQRMYVPPGQVPASEAGSPLHTNHIFKHVQARCGPCSAAWLCMPCCRR